MNLVHFTGDAADRNLTDRSLRNCGATFTDSSSISKVQHWELFYRSGKKLMAVGYEAGPSFSAGKPHVLFEGPYVPMPRTFPDYDVSPDGQRFLMLKPAEEQQAVSQIVVVQNWIEELKQKVPIEKNWPLR